MKTATVKTYSITEVSKMYHLPTTTLRYYEDLGLLYDIPRIKGRRAYTQQHLNRLGAICCFKDTGMTLKELQELGGTVERVQSVISAEEERFMANIDGGLRRLLQQLPQGSDRHCRERKHTARSADRQR